MTHAVTRSTQNSRSNFSDRQTVELTVTVVTTNFTDTSTSRGEPTWSNNHLEGGRHGDCPHP